MDKAVLPKRKALTASSVKIHLDLVDPDHYSSSTKTIKRGCCFAI